MGFLLNQTDINRLRATVIEEVWIDVSRGSDVSIPAEGALREQGPQQIDATSSHRQSATARALRTPPTGVRKQGLEPTSLEAEIRAATKICADGKDVMASIFNEARMGRAINPDAAGQLVQDISASVIRHSSALISLARLKTADTYTYMHSVAVSALMVSLARRLDMSTDEVTLAGLSGLLHDIGKATIPLEVLNKPSQLTDGEFALIKTHPEQGFHMLKACEGFNERVLDAVLHHHEKVGGGGYPNNISGDELSVLARMTAICDVYDAITSNRPYKRGWDPADAMHRMESWTEGHLDKQLFHAFVQCVGIYPIGSLVRLSSGRLAVVIAQSNSLVAPRVKVFYSTETQSRVLPYVVDLSLVGNDKRIISREDPQRWEFPDLKTLWID